MPTYGLTEQGFLAKRFDDITTDIKADIKTYFGIDLDSVPDNKFKILVNILSLPLAENWASAQALQSMMDIDQASGIFLDYLCASKLIYRQKGVKSSGDIVVNIPYDRELTLPANSSFYNNNNNEFKTTVESTVNKDTAHTVKAYIPPWYVGDITLVLNGVTYTRNTVTEGGILLAIEQLKADLFAGEYFVEETVVSGVFVWDISNTGNITAETSTFTVELTSGFELDDCKVGLAYAVDFVEEGDFTFLANTVTISPAFTAIESFYNTVINGGRYTETDEEFRERFKLSPSRLGKATDSAIKSAMLSLEGVSDVSVNANRTMAEDAQGRPPKSVEVVVKGGDDLEIANKLYDVIPAGMEFVGDVGTEILDVNNKPLVQYYSRVVNKYIWIRLTYTKYDEEEFPSNGGELIKQTLLETINNLPVGKDVIQGRVAANIYKNVTGIEVMDVELFGSVDVNATPVYSSTDPVRLSSGEEALQLIGNIIVQEG